MNSIATAPLHMLLKGDDPAFNLALEERLFETLPDDHPGLFLLWRNRPCLIIGRYQCAMDEVDAALASEYNLPVLRRISGGGAVYQDLGNLNFSFIANSHSLKPNFSPFLDKITKALADLGIPAQISGRNDLEIEGYKISGNAQKKSGHKILHHGTLLVDTNLEMLGRTLTPAKSKLEARGIKSVAARTRNLKDFKADLDMDALIGSLISCCAPKPGIVRDRDIQMAKDLAQTKYRDFHWNLGEARQPCIQAQKKFPWGEIVWKIRVSRGIISDCRIYGDFFGDYPLNNLTKFFVGLPYSRTHAAAAMSHIDLERYFYGAERKELADFFFRNMPE